MNPRAPLTLPCYAESHEVLPSGNYLMTCLFLDGPRLSIGLGWGNRWQECSKSSSNGCENLKNSVFFVFVCFQHSWFVPFRIRYHDFRRIIAVRQVSRSVFYSLLATISFCCIFSSSRPLLFNCVTNRRWLLLDPFIFTKLYFKALLMFLVFTASACDLAWVLSLILVLRYAAAHRLRCQA